MARALRIDFLKKVFRFRFSGRKFGMGQTLLYPPLIPSTYGDARIYAGFTARLHNTPILGHVPVLECVACPTTSEGWLPELEFCRCSPDITLIESL